jgi:translation initiation factor IF-1
MRRRGRMPEPTRGPLRAAASYPARILEALPNALFRVELETEGRPQLTAHVSGSSSLLRVLPGEMVLVEPSALDAGRGRIVGRAGSESGRSSSIATAPGSPGRQRT